MSPYDFGYTWYWTHGHLIVAAFFALLTAASVWRRWSRWLTAAGAAAALWAVVGFWITQSVFGANRPLDLPTDAFFRNGSGEVLDAGAGSGRATVMMVQARPEARVTALDIYSGHFGIDDNTPERLLANAQAAGAGGRVTAVTGDMRAMPFEDARFDAVVSSYAIDHLDGEGIGRALAEVSRVLRPGGEFLLIVVNVDAWVRIAYPFPHGHGYFSTPQNAERWRLRIEEAGLTVAEASTRPAMLYFVARKPINGA